MKLFKPALKEDLLADTLYSIAEILQSEAHYVVDL
jgi:hypothetical protein